VDKNGRYKEIHPVVGTDAKWKSDRVDLSRD
jgi:hypothetical protein